MIERKYPLFMRRIDGSITVFLTLLFGLIFALVTAAFENVRFLTADAYLYSAAEMASMSVFGDYNRELYQEYGLFGYGGYGGHGTSELCSSLAEALSANLQTEPETGNPHRSGGGWKDLEGYTSLYRIGEVAVDLSETTDLTEKDVFYQQLEAYLKTQVVTDLTEKIRNTCQGVSDADKRASLQENLEMADQYEKGEFETQETEETEQGGEDPGTIPSPAPSVSAAPDHAGGNPLETFRELLRDGALNLVCDAKDLSEENIAVAYSSKKQKKSPGAENSKEAGTAELLKGLLADDGGIFADGALKGSGERAKLVCYAQHVFPHYAKSGKQHFHYGLEYLISGSRQERDNLQGIVNRLLVIRTILNFAYVHSDAALQTESLATASEIAGVLGLPVLVTAIQQTILLILSVEESCVDITALLAGKSVPVWKNAANFQMTYPEICSANKVLFQAKAQKYPTGGTQWKEGSMSYQQYLWMLLMTIPEKSLRLRVYDLIQDDLQMRFHETFSLEQCISGMQYRVSYQMPFLWSGLLPKGQRNGMVRKNIYGQYSYHS